MGRRSESFRTRNLSRLRPLRSSADEHIMRRIRGTIYCNILVLLAAWLAGCGGETRERHPIAGTVTYQGKPVEMGSIRFEAEASVGDFAPACYASIKDGKYQTQPEDSPTTGKYRVLVMGIDVSRIRKDGPPGTPWDMPALFPPHTTAIDVPAPGGKFDIEVPAAASRAKR
jgi:hypothetical protein